MNINDIGSFLKFITILEGHQVMQKNCKKYYWFSVVPLLYHKKTFLWNSETAYQDFYSIKTDILDDEITLNIIFNFKNYCFSNNSYKFFNFLIKNVIYTLLFFLFICFVKIDTVFLCTVLTWNPMSYWVT